jgi:hypothetical protein
VLKISGIEFLLLKLFNAVLEYRTVPSVWSQCILKPIPKGADKDPFVPLNYRAISILSCIGKLFTCIINNRIVRYLDDQDIMVDEQNGFRQNRSCI